MKGDEGDELGMEVMVESGVTLLELKLRNVMIFISLCFFFSRLPTCLVAS